jgi:hypothetical protein
VQCLAFLGNGDVLAGDSGGVILICSKTTVEPTPGKGPKGIVSHVGSSFLVCSVTVAVPSATQTRGEGAVRRPYERH